MSQCSADQALWMYVSILIDPGKFSAVPASFSSGDELHNIVRSRASGETRCCGSQHINCFLFAPGLFFETWFTSFNPLSVLSCFISCPTTRIFGDCFCYFIDVTMQCFTYLEKHSRCPLPGFARDVIRIPLISRGCRLLSSLSGSLIHKVCS